MERYKTIDISSIESTNSFAKSLPELDDSGLPVVVMTDNQTGGRGQRGNHWESEAGKNLTFSVVLYPRWMSASNQFELSMLVSIGIINALRRYVDTPQWLKIKWPNDIYFGEKKIAGILIENSIGDNRIEKSVIGIGINVNQSEFKSDAPNPVSLIHISGSETDRRELLTNVVENILDMIDQYESDSEPDELSYLYNSMLWRNDNGYHRWQTPDGKEFEAKLDRVDTDGRLWLVEASGNAKSYLFKEVQAIL